ncbi:MAG: Spy/CpxP family protein refolding chaperone [Bryobacterales bacterium]|nr:Spy/CpxP family protein refolding chaperone [Bryobacterales bacterium]
MNQVMTKVAIWGAAAAITLGGFAAVAQAQGGPGGPHRGGPGGFLGGMMGDMLGLTDAQKEQIRTITKTAFDSNTALREQMKVARDAEREAVKAGKSDADLAQLAASQSQLFTQMHTARLQTEAKIYQVLTPEQRTKLETMREKMRTRFSQAAERFGARGGPRGF